MQVARFQPLFEERALVLDPGGQFLDPGFGGHLGGPVQFALNLGDIGDVVLQDREQLSKYGMVTVVLNLSSKNKKILGKPKFVSRGFVYVKTSKDMFHEMERIVVDRHSEWLKKSDKENRHNEKELLSAIEKSLSKYVYTKTEREPKILPVTI